jgi:CRISPR-associated protein Csx3
MGEYYKAEIIEQSDGVVRVEVGFGAPAQNSEIVPDAIAAVKGLGLAGGKGIKFDGPASVPVAVALGHAVAHLYGWVAWLDPKQGRYVVAVSHDPAVKPGDLLE